MGNLKLPKLNLRENGKLEQTNYCKSGNMFRSLKMNYLAEFYLILIKHDK